MHQRRFKRLTGFLIAVCCASAHAEERYRGDTFDLADGQLLYREVHFLFEKDGAAQRVVLYECPDGRAFARKQVHSSSDPQIPDFEMIDARWNYREGVRTREQAREAYVVSGGDVPEKTQILDIPADAVIDAGFDEFVRRHWDDLAAGKRIKLSFLVPSRRAFYGFKVSSVESDPQTMRVRLSLGSWYAFLLPHIDVVYDRATHHLQEYEGLSNVRDANLKNYNVRTRFDYTLSNEPLAASIEQALAKPLSPDCSTVRADTAAVSSGH